MQHLIGEFMALARTTSVPTPTINRWLLYYEPEAPRVPDGSAEIPLRWGGLAFCLSVLATLVTGGVLLANWLFGKDRR